MTAEVLFCDNHLLAANKPAGMPVQQDRTGDPDLLSCLKQYLQKRFDKPGNVYLGLVHRLDRPVSGVMVFARTSKAAGRLAAQFREGTARKRYIAVAEGRISGRGRCEDYLLKKNEVVRIAGAGEAGALHAELAWRSAAAGKKESLLDIELMTGRPHQIRLQLASRGMPILGDLRYGSRREFDGRNLALHCYRLGLEHPVLKAPVVWTAAPPPTWDGFFDADVTKLLSAV